MLAGNRKGWIRALGLGAVLVAAGLFASRPCMSVTSKTEMRAEDAAQQPDSAPQGKGATHPHTNRLIHEKSPYLLLHAHNPVDWYPWGEEAFAKARREQRPIFLSIGYFTCHWCHVMERESFSDPAIAEIMNRSFVSIKVDREERTDLDRIYMSFVQATTGSGGWPMSVFLTPDRKPFFGGTYFPKDNGYGRMGFRTVLLRIADAWQKDRGKILQSADQVTLELQKRVNADVGDPRQLQPVVLDKTYEQIRASYDRTYSGFGGAPKFPRPVVLGFLLRYYARTGQKEALTMTLATLRAMAQGGIHDHIGGGFHRYATDATWHVPHFEKMLYDQAQLAVSYIEAFQITHELFFAETAREVLEFVLREMRGLEGGFYSALDADSLIEFGKPEHGEGAFYVWEAKDIEKSLGPEAGAVFNFHYGVEPGGNVPSQQDFQGEFRRKNILVVRHSAAQTAQHFGKPEVEIRAQLDAARKHLFDSRLRRPHPPLDDKVLVAWNGLMISAFARASQVLEEPRYEAAAVAALAFVRAKLYNPQTETLTRRYRAGEAAVSGLLDDYAFLIQGLLDTYEASFDVRWLAWAIRLQEKQGELFRDAKAGGYFTATGTDHSILLQIRESYDGAEPSPNSIAAMNLLRLWQVTDRKV